MWYYCTDMTSFPCVVQTLLLFCPGPWDVATGQDGPRRQTTTTNLRLIISNLLLVVPGLPGCCVLQANKPPSPTLLTSPNTTFRTQARRRRRCRRGMRRSPRSTRRSLFRAVATVALRGAGRRSPRRARRAPVPAAVPPRGRPARPMARRRPPPVVTTTALWWPWSRTRRSWGSWARWQATWIARPTLRPYPPGRSARPWGRLKWLPVTPVRATYYLPSLLCFSVSFLLFRSVSFFNWIGDKDPLGV